MTGQTMYLNIVKLYDKFFNDNYNKLLNDATSITQHYDYSVDMVHDNYLKVRNKIWKNGFNGDNYYGYLWLSIKNDWRVLKNREKIRKFIDIDDTTNHFDDIEKAEQYLLVEDNWNKQQEEYYQSVEYVVMELFKFVETRYDEKQSYIFKCYFLLCLTYKELSNQTGYSQSYISNTIKPLKKDIKHNFEQYLKTK